MSKDDFVIRGSDAAELLRVKCEGLLRPPPDPPHLNVVNSGPIARVVIGATRNMPLKTPAHLVASFCGN